MKSLKIFAILIPLILNVTGYENCGREQRLTEVRIFSGTPKEEYEQPWLVALHNRIRDNFICAGSLISNKHVLTAAHCLQLKGEREITLPHELLCKVGRFNLSDSSEEECVDSLVWDTIIHPYWDSNSFSFDSDIAIVVLRNSVELSDKIQPVCLPQLSFEDVFGLGTIVGWGKSEFSEILSKQHDETPSKIFIPAINASHCYTTYPLLAKHSSNGIFCGGYENEGKGPCLGDSGGGFYLQNPLSDQWNIRGIVSGSLRDLEHGCDINKFQLYTNVARFVDWIEQTMNESTETLWQLVSFNCSEIISGSVDTFCNLSYDGPVNKTFRIAPNFSGHKSKKTGSEVKKLKISFQKATQIFLGIGEVFPELEKLQIDVSSKLLSIEREDFSSLTNLKELVINSIPIKFIAEDAFQDVPQLEVLDLNHCQITSFPEYLFKNLSKLKSLDLSLNPIESFAAKTFEGLANLKNLDLSSCGVTSMPESLFHNLFNLKVLNLNMNLFKTVEDNAFRDLFNLEALKLFFCKVEALTENVFANLKSLKELDLTTNRFKILPENIFWNLSNLETLNIEDNRVIELPKNLLKNSLRLKRFLAFDASLQNIYVDFTKLPELVDLDLRKNRCVNGAFMKNSPKLTTHASIEDLQNVIDRNCT